MDPKLYQEHAELEADHWWFVARRMIVSEVLDEFVGASHGRRRILDAGCGTGGMLPMLARYGEVTGVEPEPAAVEQCRARFSDFDVRVGSVPEGVVGSGTYDLVTAFDVIEHIDDDEGALRGLASVLAAGGTLLVTVPALAWLWSDHDVLNGHHRRYDRRGLLAVLEGAGLEVVHASYFNTVLLPVVAAARVAQRVRPSKAEVDMTSDFSMPGPRMNRLLTRVMGAERRVVARRGLPIGVSLIAVATVRPTA